MAAFDWQAMMRAGIGQRRIPVADFWNMTPVELLLVVNPERASSKPMGRTGFEIIQAQFPDNRGDSNE